MSKRQEDIERFSRLATSSYQPGTEGTGVTAAKDETSSRSIIKVIGKSIVVVLVASLIITLVIALWSMRNFSVMSERMFDGQSAFQLFPTTPLKADADGRTNLLIVGYAADRPDHGGSELTDTILLLSLDGTNGGYMLSIPRDLFVDIPYHHTARINEAFSVGERIDFAEAGYRDGGIGLLEKVVTENFGIDIHYQVTTNFEAVEQIVDAVGGIVVEIESPDDRGIYDPNFQPHEGGPLELENGLQAIDGQTALRLTRARGSAGGYGFPQSDFNRTKNQQKVLAAVANELSWQQALDPRINKKLFDAVSASTRTDVDMSEVIPLYRALTRVPVDQIDSYTLRDIEGESLLTDHTSYRGEATLIPSAGINDYSVIRQAIQSIHQ